MGDFLALSLIVLVAAFNIMSILVMSVLIKTPEIGILRTIGCTVGEIYPHFHLSGVGHWRHRHLLGLLDRLCALLGPSRALP